jgi:hypothetical protein
VGRKKRAAAGESGSEGLLWPQAKKRKEREIDGPKGKLGLQLSLKKEERRERF